MLPFSVIISVYKNDIPDFVRLALDSILIEQILKPNEIVLVRDGQVSEELDRLIDEYDARYPELFNIIRLNQNCGLGLALKKGVESAKYNIIARMDSDDISLPNRFFLQLQYLERHQDVDIVGGQMSEFIGTPDNIVSKRIVPCSNDDIYDYMKGRCAFNHVTVMFRKNAVLKAGNYLDWFWNEDYYLWVRMAKEQCRFANLPEILVNVRSGSNQYARRGGRRYYESEKGIKKYQLQNGMISRVEYVFFMAQRFVVQILMPNWMRGRVFRLLARKK